MIGTSVRGLRHLWRLSDSSPKKILAKFGERTLFCDVIKIKTSKDKKENLYIFNSCYGQCSVAIEYLVSLSTEAKKIVESSINQKVFEVCYNNDSFVEYNNLISGIVLLPPSFDEDYEAFTKANSKIFNNLSKKYGVSKDDCSIKEIYIYTDGSKNFFQWAVDLYYKNVCSISTIQNILLWHNCYKQLTKKLSKGTITAYTNFKSINELMQELANLRNEKRINDAINSFNTAQKKLFKSNELSDIEKTALSKFGKLSEAKRLNFIKKVSSITDYQELMRQMKHVTSMHFSWSKESFMDYIQNVEGINYKIICEDEDSILVEVYDYDTIKQLGKTTNWCISKNKTYWNNYMCKGDKETKQYVFFDFSKKEDDKLSIIGFTTTYNEGITSAHNFINDDLLKQPTNYDTLSIKSYLKNFREENSIYEILQKHNIEITLVAQYDKLKYEWNYEGLMSYLYECVSKENVDIIKHENNKLVLSVCDENIGRFLGDKYMAYASHEFLNAQHILFIDFSLSEYSPNKIVYGIIYNNIDEDYCYELFNENLKRVNDNFDSKLVEFGIPYDIIRRPNNISKRVKNAFFSYDLDTIRECTQQDKKCFIKMLHSIDGEDIIAVLEKATLDLVSFDFLDYFYENKCPLKSFLPQDYVVNLLSRAFNQINGTNISLYGDVKPQKPTDEQINAFYNMSLTNREETYYVGCYLIIKKIILNEKDEIIYSRFINRMPFSPLAKEFAYDMLHNSDMSENKRATQCIIRYFLNGDDEMKNTVLVLCDKYEWIKDFTNKSTSSSYSSINEGLGYTYAIADTYAVAGAYNIETPF